jgi:hypothetical protein
MNDLHAYKNGYSTLPNLKKINVDNIFEKNYNNDSFLIQREKKEALENQKYFFEYNNPSFFYEICEDFIKKNYPRKLQSNKYLDIAKEIDEDLIIHRIENNKDYTSSIHVCFPSHWLPEEKIGKSFDQIHQPVPMNLKNSSKLVGAIINNGIFERFVWSVIYEKKYNSHPRFESKKFNKNKPEFYVKVERQITVGFPEHQFCLFILRQYIIEEKDIDKKSLLNSIKSMEDNHKKYKSLCFCL